MIWYNFLTNDHVENIFIFIKNINISLMHFIINEKYAQN